MKKTNITRKIAAMLAAAMMMTTAAAITASAQSAQINPNGSVCTSDCREKESQTLFEQVQKWVEQITPKKTESKENKDISKMERGQKLDYAQTVYGMNAEQLNLVENTAKYYKYQDFDLEYTEAAVHRAIERQGGRLPAWTDGMYRYMRDHWEQI